MRRFVVNLEKVDLSVENLFINHVHLRKAGFPVLECIIERIAKFPRAETLKLENCSIQLDSNWDKTINSLKSLKEFKIPQSKVTAENSRELWNLPALKVLSFIDLDLESTAKV
jgi:Leucine-rich repeat (LRR) protein